MRLTVLALLLVLSACAVPADPPPGPPPAATAENCAAAGGEWRPVCRTQRPMCVRAYKDAGKVCTDSNQCDGRCVGEGEDVKSGVCEADNDPCGCATEMIAGRPRTICVD